MLELYKNIRKYRKQMGLTQEELQMRLTPLILLGLRGLVTQMVTNRQRISVLCLPFLYAKSLPLATRQAPRKEMSKTGYHGLRLVFTIRQRHIL